ncbi:YjjG family noncanonical pyrimidine nucleotidase [Mucilaginibacter terrae]|uniref:Hydrolase of the HAD superfamily n=1 Tax=Mucilaginibacter terrae TaxID=1955052 RepID=A0ABU3GVQ2_9SPHI|nr:YjjG family noncanonical pyrimidine nucleotidase [Mucilaginibacter terrae]MDT3403042.1 putative hydrolase of the HAD superfamily [Mucilaginibacter terrae]
MKRYTNIFFDLDHTIWDFDRNAEETLHELFVLHELEALGIASAVEFIATYTRNNHALWADYHLGKIDKETLRQTRFRKTFMDMGLHPDVIPVTFEDAYVELCPTKTNLFPHAHETLAYLQSKYTLHIISNGFESATRRKIAGTGLAQYFDNIIISELVGVNKPDKAIFEYALQLSGAKKEESIMIGDSLEADVYGALNFGIDAIYFNPLKANKPTGVPVQIFSLNELINLL